MGLHITRHAVNQFRYKVKDLGREGVIAFLKEVLPPDVGNLKTNPACVGKLTIDSSLGRLIAVVRVDGGEGTWHVLTVYPDYSHLLYCHWCCQAIEEGQKVVRHERHSFCKLSCKKAYKAKFRPSPGRGARRPEV